MLIKANPKSTSKMFEERYTKKYDNLAKIERIETVEKNGTKHILVHLRGIRGENIIDWFGRKRPETSMQDFAQQMLNRATAAQKAAKVKSFKEEIEAREVRKKVYEIFKKLIGKTVFIHQWTPEDSSNPRINYDFSEEALELVKKKSKKNKVEEEPESEETEEDENTEEGEEDEEDEDMDFDE